MSRVTKSLQGLDGVGGFKPYNLKKKKSCQGHFQLAPFGSIHHDKPLGAHHGLCSWTFPGDQLGNLRKVSPGYWFPSQT